MQRSPIRDTAKVNRTISAPLRICVLTVALATPSARLSASSLDLAPGEGTLVEVPAIPQGIHLVTIAVTGCPRLEVRSITVRELVVAAPTTVAIIVYDTRTGEAVAAGEAAVRPGRSVAANVPVAVSLDAGASYGVVVGYGDGVSAYRMIDPEPTGQGGFPYAAGGRMVRVLEAWLSSPVVLPLPSLVVPILSVDVLPCGDEPEESGEQARFRRGDANFDGDVDLADAVSMLESLFIGRGEFPCEDAADANDDGDIDISDVITTLAGLFLGGPEIPAPGPTACGDDPTEDRLSCGGYRGCDSTTESFAVVNGVPLDAGVIRSLEEDYGITVLPGDYWYDRVSGAYGLRGGPTMGFILAGLDIGGPLAQDASAGDTGVLVNGRELPRTELDALELVLGPIPAGRYWLDSQGNYGYEGQPALGNLVEALLAARGQPSGNGYLERTYFGSIGSDGQTSYFFDASTGCSVISGGGVSC